LPITQLLSRTRTASAAMMSAVRVVLLISA
jgi:hypothetical protein